MPAQFAFARIDPDTHTALSDNRNPDFTWSDLPHGCRSLVLICVDPDVPTRFGDYQATRIVNSVATTGFTHVRSSSLANSFPDCGATYGACPNNAKYTHCRTRPHLHPI